MVAKEASSSGSNLAYRGSEDTGTGRRDTDLLSRNSSRTRRAKKRAWGVYFLEPSALRPTKRGRARRQVSAAFCWTAAMYWRAEGWSGAWAGSAAMAMACAICSRSRLMASSSRHVAPLSWPRTTSDRIRGTR
jgi:hypothetical protein